MNVEKLFYKIIELIQKAQNNFLEVSFLTMFDLLSERNRLIESN